MKFGSLLFGPPSIFKQLKVHIRLSQVSKNQDVYYKHLYIYRVGQKGVIQHFPECVGNYQR